MSTRAADRESMTISAVGRAPVQMPLPVPAPAGDATAAAAAATLAKALQTVMSAAAGRLDVRV